MKYNHLIGQGFARWYSGEYTEAQIEALSDFDNSFILLSGSYRSGKSEIASRLALRHAMVFPGSKVFIVREHLTSIKKSTLRTFLQLVHPDWVADWSNTSLTMRFHNGSEVAFLGCSDPDKIGSIEASLIFVDEAHEISEESFGMLQGRLSAKLSLPADIDKIVPEYREYAKGVVDNNQMFLACNPKSKGHWLYKHFIENPKPNHKCYTSNSISNGNLPVNYLLNNLAAYVRDGKKYGIDFLKDAISKIRKGLKPSNGLHLMSVLNTQGQRNLLGQWVAAEGLIFSLDERDHWISLEKYREITDGRVPRYYGAVDWGFQNPRIVVTEYYKEIDLHIVVKFWSKSGETPDEMISEMERMSDEFGIEKWFLPPDQPGLIKKAKRSSISAFSVKKAANAVLPGIDAVYTRFLHRKLLILNDGSEVSKLCWEETSGYEWATNRDGERTDKPVKARDHFPDAIRYLIYSLDRKKRNRRANEETEILL